MIWGIRVFAGEFCYKLGKKGESIQFILQADWRSQEIGKEKGIWNLNFCWDYNWVHGLDLGLGPYFCLWAQKVDGPV